MRSKTSYFNRTIFIKTMARFWPLWAAYFAVWFFFMPMYVIGNRGYFANDSLLWQRNYIYEMGALGGVVVGMITAALAAMAVWSFLYSARSMSGMVSLPVRREGVFFSVTLAGIVPVLAANVLIVLCTLGAQLTCVQTDIPALALWLAVVSLIYVFFYGFAVFCAQLTGNILVLPAVYAVLSFVVDAVWEMVNALCSVFVYGMEGGVLGFSRLARVLSPPVELWLTGTAASQRIETWDAVEGISRTVAYEFHGWVVYAAYAAAGLAFAALALWLYKKRRMESAGDTVAVGVLKPVFKYCMGLGGGLVFALLVYSVTGDRSSVGLGGAMVVLLYMFIGAFLGWVIAKMLIHKSFHVWKSDWLGLGICCAVAAVFMLSMECDLVGFEKNVPDPSEVYNVYIGGMGDFMLLEDPANIEAVTALHRSVVEHKDRYESIQKEFRNASSLDYDSIYMTINYALKSGGYISRRYHLGYDMTQPETYDDVLSLQTLANTDEAVLSRKTPGIPVNAVTAYYGYAEGTVFPGDSYRTPDGSWVYMPADSPESEWRLTWDFTPSELAELYNTCIVPDIEDGTLGRVWYITDGEYEKTVYNARIYIELRQPLERSGQSAAGASEYAVGEYTYATFFTTPTVDSWRTNAWLEKHGVSLHTLAEVNALLEAYDGELYGAPRDYIGDGPVARIPTSSSSIYVAGGVG